MNSTATLSGHSGAVQIGNDLRINFIHERAASLLGKDASALIGQGVEAFGDTLACACRQILSEGKSILLQTGAALEVELHPYPDGVLGVIREKHPPREVSQEFRALLDGIPDALVRVDPEMKIVWGNRAAGTMLGMEENALAGRHCFEVWHRKAVPCEGCPARRCFASGRTEEEVIRRSGGSVFGVKAFPLFDGEGGVSSVLVLSVDITEKMRLREESIHQSRLASLGELAAGIAHEINNPNALILFNAPVVEDACRQMLELLKEKEQKEGDFLLGRLPFSRMRTELPRLQRELGEAAQRIRRIVEDLKDFAREDRDVHRDDADLNEAAEAAIRLVGNFIRKSTTCFETDYRDPLPRVRGNLQRIEQVAVNLIMNACQALPDPSRGITVRTRRDAAGKGVQLSVSDEGVGIPAKNMPRILEPFFTTRKGRGGTGLGLSVSAGIVSEYGGTIHFDSEPGKGTTVTVTLPLADPEAES